MPYACCAVDCHSRYIQGEMNLFRFPEDDLQRDAWIRAIRREKWMPDEDSRLCQLHFISGRPPRYPNNPDYAPTRFSYKSTSAVIEKSNINRYERLQARRRKLQHYSEHQKQGQKRRRKHLEKDSEVQQIPSEVPNDVDLCTGEPNHYSDVANHSVGPPGSSNNVEPDENLELPAGSVELPSDNMELPVANLELPAGSVELPSDNVELPVDNLELPDGSVELPAYNVELPVNNVEQPTDNMELPADNVQLPIADDDDIEFSISLDLPELFKVYEKLRSTDIELCNTKEELRKANEKIISLEEQLKSVK